MEIKEARVPNELRFAQQTHSIELPKDNSGVPWMYVVLLCGGCILLTMAVVHLKDKKRNRGNSFCAFRSKIE